MSGFSTHILDLAVGRPASGVAIRLFVKRSGVWVEQGAMRTDVDGRAKLLAGEQFNTGAYRLEFDVGPYFRASGAAVGEPGFLEIVAIECNVSDASHNHHVPLLVSPFGYSTYRGS